MTHHEFLNILKKAKVSQGDFFRVHGRSAAATGVKWRKDGVVPPWIEKHALALIEVPGYRDYIIDQDLDKLKGRQRHERKPTWFKSRKNSKGNAI